jgi:hypothetical protein
MATKPTSAPKQPKPVTGAHVRMYRLGTGDCFVIKFLTGKTATYTLMIDCGAWTGSKSRFKKHIEDLKAHVDNRVDALVVTHEHKDHVVGFELCEDLFTEGFEVGETWLSWTEEDGDPAVEKLKKEYGAKKKALAAASDILSKAVHDPNNQSNYQGMHMGLQLLEAQQRFAAAVEGFRDLHGTPDSRLAAAGGNYVGDLEGMKVVKQKISSNRIRHFKPGDIIDEVPGLEGVRIYVLGPPRSIAAIKAEDSGEPGETYDPNKELANSAAFAAAASAFGGASGDQRPFDRSFESGIDATHPYEQAENFWRRIDQDWLMSAGSLALRLNTGINNLSLAIAIEFVASGRVMLFPGDAEYGSWASWHQINWKQPGTGKHKDGSPKHLTEDLLNRTVFYKVAHHLSHNGTARRLGLAMMTHQDLAAMATLDYEVISNGWKGTMPNQDILTELLEQTKGRLMVMNPKGLFFDARKTIPLKTRIGKSRRLMSPAEKKAFDTAHEESELWIDFKVKG